MILLVCIWLASDMNISSREKKISSSLSKKMCVRVFYLFQKNVCAFGITQTG